MSYLKSPMNRGVGTGVVYGFLFSIVLFIVLMVISTLFKASGANGCLTIIIYLAVGFPAGFVASRRTRKWGAGCLAGLLAGLFASLMQLVVLAVFSAGLTLIPAITLIAMSTILTGIGGAIGGYTGAEE